MATKITVNEKVYDSVDAMPPDVRAIYEQAMRAASTAGPVVKHSEIKVTFQMGGPHFKFRVGSGTTPAGETPAIDAARVEPSSTPARADAPPPIEPASGSAGLQIAIVVAVGLAIGLAFWYWASVH